MDLLLLTAYADLYALQARCDMLEHLHDIEQWTFERHQIVRLALEHLHFPHLPPEVAAGYALLLNHVQSIVQPVKPLGER